MKKSNGALETRAKQAVNFQMTDYMATNIISDCEARITSNRDAMSKIEVELKELREKLQPLESQYNALKSKIQDDEILASIAAKQKHGIKQSASIRLIRATSLNDMKDREIRKTKTGRNPQLTWNAFAIEVLKEKGHMMSISELWDAVYIKFDIANTFERYGYDKSRQFNARWGAINKCWKPTSEAARNGSARALLFMYNDLIGLKEWATDDFKPLPQYTRALSKAI